MVTEVGEPGTNGPREWVLKRNCSLAPRQLCALFAALALLSLAIATAWTIYGARFVIWFALIEVAALGVALVAYGRHAADYERIKVDERGLLVEQHNGTAVERIVLARPGVRVEPPAGSRRLIRLSGASQGVEVGRLATEPERRWLARELGVALRAG